MIRVGAAGWQIPKSSAGPFPTEGSTLERYAAVFSAVEINSSFYRPHKPATYARWAASTPDDFRFSLKLPRTITHESRLVAIDELLARFLGGARALGTRLGVLVIQLPPSLPFDSAVAERFLAALRTQADEAAALEPRHASWFGGEAAAMLDAYQVARVGADPARVPEAAEPGGWRSLTYLRLHGAPRTYVSTYDEAFIAKLTIALKADPAEQAWCMFDNTMLGGAIANGLSLAQRL